MHIQILQTHKHTQGNILCIFTGIFPFFFIIIYGISIWLKAAWEVQITKQKMPTKLTISKGYKYLGNFQAIALFVRINVFRAWWKCIKYQIKSHEWYFHNTIDSLQFPWFFNILFSIINFNIPTLNFLFCFISYKKKNIWCCCGH